MKYTAPVYSIQNAIYITNSSKEIANDGQCGIDDRIQVGPPLIYFVMDFLHYFIWRFGESTVLLKTLSDFFFFVFNQNIFRCGLSRTRHLPARERERENIILRLVWICNKFTAPDEHQRCQVVWGDDITGSGDSANMLSKTCSPQRKVVYVYITYTPNKIAVYGNTVTTIFRKASLYTIFFFFVSHGLHLFLLPFSTSGNICLKDPAISKVTPPITLSVSLRSCRSLSGASNQSCGTVCAHPIKSAQSWSTWAFAEPLEILHFGLYRVRPNLKVEWAVPPVNNVFCNARRSIPNGNFLLSHLGRQQFYKEGLASATWNIQEYQATFFGVNSFQNFKVNLLVTNSSPVG